MTPIQKILIEIQETESFEKLEAFKNPQIWEQMVKEERELFALLLIQLGTQQLAKGHQQVLDNFDIAAKVSLYSPAVLYQQGMAFASYKENGRCLHLACQAFAQAVKVDPSFTLAWYNWALTLFNLGELEGEITYFIEADLKFQTAFNLTVAIPSIDRGMFHWNWGRCLAALGKLCEEPIDFYRAINQYRLAAESGIELVTFFNNHGQALADLATLLEKQELFLEALKLFEQAIESYPESFEAWYNRACCLLKINEQVLKEDDLEQIFDSFERAAELNPDYTDIWLKWGQLETSVGKIKRDEKILEAGLEKFAKANQLDPYHPLILSCWAETELFLGANQERLDLLQSAKLKLIKSLEMHPENVDTWYLYGSCLNELGRYFADKTFYRQAIEKFEYGLSLAEETPFLWYGLALSHFSLGELTDDETAFEKAVSYCSRVVDYGGGTFAQFWNDWGVALLKLGEMKDQQNFVELAIEKFERALKQPVFSVDQEDVDLEWVYNYGCAFDLLGDLTEEAQYFERAIQILTQVLQLDPNYSHARYNLALSLSHLGEANSDVEPYHKAIEHFHRLIEEDPEDELIHMDFGISLINLALLIQEAHHPERSQALYRQAEHHLTQATFLGNSEAYYQLAGLYSLTGQYPLSMHCMERAKFFAALPGLDDLMHDDWLENLRQTTPFRQFINQLSSQHETKEEK